ncbi:hypothetical protein ScalyP_jg4823 [Parmales sp. scaly parma]|nr:hypothetical protein ScalyP_jg4823 [Parmales sp. scaly parma]
MYIQHLISTFLSSTDWKTSEGVLVALTSLATRFAPVPVPILDDKKINFSVGGSAMLFVPSLPVPLSIPLLLSAFTHSQAKVRESASLFLTSMLRRISNSPPAVVDLATESLQALLNLKNNDNNNNSNHHQADGLLSCLVVLLHSSHAEFLFDCDLNFMFAGLSALQSSASTVRQGGAEVLTALASKDAERTATTFARLAACWRPQTDSDSSDWHLQEGILISYEAMLNEVTSCHLFDSNSNSNSAHTHTILPELVTEKNKNKFDLDVITSHISTSLGSSTFELRRISLMATKSLAKIFCWFDVGRFSISSPSELEIFKAGILHSQHVLEEMEMKMEMVPRHHPWGSSHSGIADCDAARNVNLSVKRCASEFKPECENMIESMKRHCVSRWLPELENLEMLILVQAFCGVFVQRTTVLLEETNVNFAGEKKADLDSFVGKVLPYLPGFFATLSKELLPTYVGFVCEWIVSNKEQRQRGKKNWPSTSLSVIDVLQRLVQFLKGFHSIVVARTLADSDGGSVENQNQNHYTILAMGFI